MNTDGTNEPVDDGTAPVRPASGAPGGRLRIAAGATAAGLLAVAGIGGMVMTGAVKAADTVATSLGSAAASPATSAAPAASGAPAATDDADGDKDGSRGAHETVTDTSVVADAIGITEADLITALDGGQTMAQVAAANNVDVQVVIDALVADGQSELDAQVAAGSLTQAEADARAADLVQ
ncbi:MAG: hypothetical protein QOH61_1513, partial [Chloroflexota bacterium]|nr:hypothetical protein [Chloroflexota bacterium]